MRLIRCPPVSPAGPCGRSRLLAHPVPLQRLLLVIGRNPKPTHGKASPFRVVADARGSRWFGWQLLRSSPWGRSRFCVHLLRLDTLMPLGSVLRSSTHCRFGGLGAKWSVLRGRSRSWLPWSLFSSWAQSSWTPRPGERGCLIGTHPVGRSPLPSRYTALKIST